MTPSTAEYKCIAIGPGGRKCVCCAPISKLLKRYEHRKARHNEKKMIAKNIEDNYNDLGYEQLQYEMDG